MHHIALQQSEYQRVRFMAEISSYGPSMLVWLDETGCDNQNVQGRRHTALEEYLCVTTNC